jgi:hypothetical protein
MVYLVGNLWSFGGLSSLSKENKYESQDEQSRNGDALNESHLHFG